MLYTILYNRIHYHRQVAQVVCVLGLCLHCWVSGGSALLALDVGDLQDGEQQLKGILDVVGAVGALRTKDSSPTSSSFHQSGNSGAHVTHCTVHNK